jgi:hypothetical protein
MLLDLVSLNILSSVLNGRMVVNDELGRIWKWLWTILMHCFAFA